MIRMTIKQLFRRTVKLLDSLNMFNGIIDYKSNKAKLDGLLIRHRDEFLKVFNERKNEESQKLSLMDYFIYLQECFYLDTILVMEKKDDIQDFFQSVNSYKRMMKIAESYIINMKGICIYESINLLTE